jgi:signal transduction histidine kinase
MRHRLGSAASVLALAAVYFAAARLGLGLDAVAGFATLVWPATGIALAALVRFGYGLWPGIFLGAFVANLVTGAPPLVAVGIGIGNTLEAVAGTWALRLIPGFRPSLDRLPDVAGLIGLAAVLSTMLSATIGVASLHFGGVVPLAQTWTAWRAWWLGDLIADLVVAPGLLVWEGLPRAAWPWQRWLEAAALVLSVILNLLIFHGSAASDEAAFVQAYLVFPPLIWAALRFGLRGAVAATLLTSVLAVWGTAAGHGPFARPVLHESLFTLQTFMAVTAATLLLLGATTAERRRALERLRRAHREVAEANRVKSEFLAVMSHELRTPLNAIAGYVELMSLGPQEPLTPVQQAYLDRIRTNQQHLTGMIEDVLNFAKVEAGRLSFTIEPVRVRDLLASAHAVIEPELRRRELTCVCEPGDASLVVRADREKLRQILLNLLGNAMKFTAAGGRIAVGAARDGGRVHLWVRDTGVGIPADQVERVFEPFFQIDHGMTRSHSGIGLGLAISRDFARGMGGELRLASTSGVGTTAILELPAAPDDPVGADDTLDASSVS